MRGWGYVRVEVGRVVASGRRVRWGIYLDPSILLLLQVLIRYCKRIYFSFRDSVSVDILVL